MKLRTDNEYSAFMVGLLSIALGCMVALGFPGLFIGFGVSLVFISVVEPPPKKVVTKVDFVPIGA